MEDGILQAKLKHLPGWNQRRRTIEQQYDELFRSQAGRIILPYEPPQTTAVCLLYVIRVKNRDQLQARLAQANIATQVHYPRPLHLQKAYATLAYEEGDFPVP